MSTTITLVLVVTFAVVVSGLVRRYTARLGFVPDAQYIVIGALLGPWGAGLLGDNTLQSLGPVISLLLGMVGFMLGLALRRRLATAHALEAGATAALFSLAAMAASFFALLLYLTRWVPGQPLWVAISLACAAAATSLPGVESTLQSVRARGVVTELVRSLSLALSVVAVAAAGTALAWRRSSQASDRFGLSGTTWLAALVGLGIASGLLFAMFMGRRKQESDDRLFLATVGVITFASGLALAADVSPLLINMLAGVVVSLLSKDAEALYAHLERLERPAIVLLMIFAGVLWMPIHSWLWLVAPAYLAIRFCVLRLITGVTCWLLPGLPRVPRVGNALLRQGGLAVAIAINHDQVSEPEGRVVLCITVIGVVVSDVIGSSAIRRVLVDAGEHQRDVVAPIAQAPEVVS